MPGDRSLAVQIIERAMAVAIDSEDHRIGEGGPLRRFERLCRLTTVGRQAVAVLLVGWLPLVVFGLVHDAATTQDDPLLHDAAMHVRLLVAAPLFLLLDKWFPLLCKDMLAKLVRQSFVTDADRGRFAAMLRRAERRSAWWVPEALLITISVGLGAAALFGIMPLGGLTVRVGPPISRIWFALVSLPLVEFLLLRSLWRWALWGTILVELSRLRLQLVPTHPDRCGGIAFLRLPSLRYCTGFLFAVTSIMAAEWGEHFAAHNDIIGLRPVLLLFALVAALVAIGPTLVFSPHLQRARYAGLDEVAELASRRNRTFHRQLMATDTRGRAEPEDAQDLAAIAHIYQETVGRIQFTLFKRGDLILLAGATTLPVAVALFARVPARDWATLAGGVLGGVGL